MTPPARPDIAGRPAVPGQPPGPVPGQRPAPVPGRPPGPRKPADPARAPGPRQPPGPARAAAAGKLGTRPGGYPAGPPWLWAIPSAVTLAVMLWGIQRPSYWRDEAATLAAVHRPFGALIRMLGNMDAVHSVYYVMMWTDVRLAGTGELATRLPSALAMAAAAAGLAAIGRRLVSPRAGLLAGLAFAALPEISWYGQDARPYALVTALAVIASYLLVRALAAGRSRRRWLAAYGLGLTAAGLVNIFALTLIPAHGLTLALARRQRGWLARRSLLAGWLAAAAVATAAAGPLIAAAWAQRGQQHWLKKPGLRTLAALRYLIGPSALVIVVLLVIGCAVAISAISAVGGRARPDWPGRLPALCLPWLLVPPAVLLAGSLIQPVYTLRYVLFSLPALALLAGAALAALGRAAGAIALAVVVLVGIPAQADVRRHGAHGDNIRMADIIVAGARRPGDAVLYGSADARNMAAAYPYGLAALRNIALDRAPIPSGTLAGTYLPAAAVRGRLSGVRRTWVVEIGGTRPARLPLLHGLRFQLVSEWRPSDIWLMLYRHRDKPYRRFREPRRASPAAGTRRLP